ncbi:MAG TPA: primosomal protein N', partial [Candidatus Caccomonas pullistercoris]|nr:primosomal protein N' [Candidatus Caccomonas pullistercoris]
MEGELIEVIVPLALPGLFTYRVPAGMAGRVAAGCRVVVPFGGRKHYTAIVARVGTRPPAEGVEVKDVAELVDDAPLVLPAQLDFWLWLAHYYMCTPGEVMRAALPSGLKLESESEVRLNPDFDPAVPLTERERALLAALGGGTGRTVRQLEKDLRVKNLLPAVRRLMDKKVVVVKENMAQRFRPKVETHVRLTGPCADEGRLNALFAELKRAPKQAALLTAYLDMAEAAAALRLHNCALLAEVAKADLLRRAGATDAVLAALTARGVLETYPFEVGRLPKGAEGPVAAPRPLSDAQQKAADEVVAAFA